MSYEIIVHKTSSAAVNATSQRCEFPITLVCPVCRGALHTLAGDLVCASCGREFEFRGGFPDLIHGDRFDDQTGEEQLRYEERCNADTVENYLLPLFQNWWKPARADAARPRLLSLGCGTGIDVDLLCEAGYDAIGIDCGNRTKAWGERREANRFMLANGKHLPFEDESFDGIFCGCVFPHVGVKGDSFEVAPEHAAERLSLAREMARVLRPGGRILVSSPNRRFPFDIFHGRSGGGYRPRPYDSRDPFLLSAADYRQMFLRAGCARAAPLPVAGYWGFIRSKHSAKGYLLALPVRMLFRLASHDRLPMLRASPLNPWLVMSIEK